MPNGKEYVPALENLADKFRALPGVGRKSAYRMAFHVLTMSNAQVKSFADALLAAKADTRRCSVCQNICDSDVCSVCSDPDRNPRQICVLEDPRDVAAVERISDYRGVFHVLHGIISPLNGIGPSDLTVKELLDRIGKLQSESDEEIEIILATNPNVEGDATAMYIARLAKPLGVKTTRLAYGIPVGGDLEYADEFTLFKAIEGRRDM
jgi:recombination protein RecR